MALMTPQEYIESLRKLNTRVYMFGEKIENWVDHPMIRPSINCVAMTYALAQDPQYAELMTQKPPPPMVSRLRVCCQPVCWTS